MSPIILAVSLAIPSSAPATPLERETAAPASAPAKAECARPGVQMADRPLGRVVPRRLDELPPARLEYSVTRHVGGCVIPAVVHEGIGR